MCESFFGMIKNQFFNTKNWKDATFDELIHELNKYLIWLKTKRIKKRLNFFSQQQFIINYQRL